MKKIIPNGATLIPDNAKCVFKGIIYDVYQWEQEMFDGSKNIFEMLKRPDTVTVIAVVDEKLLILTDEQPHRKAVLSPPGGRVDEGELSTLDAVKRELLEETGYALSNWKLVRVTKTHEKIEHFFYSYVAHGSYTKTQPNVDMGGEKINVHLMKFDEVRNLALSGEERLKEQAAIIESQNLEELLAMPEFNGQEVDR